MKCEEAKAKYLRRCRIRNLSPRTIRDYAYHIGKFKEFFGEREIEELTSDDLEDYVCCLMDEGTSVNYIRTRLRNLVGFITFLKKEGIINPTVSIPTIRTFETELVPFTNEQLKEIYDACLMYKTFSRHRDYIIMRVMEETGMRISEVLRLTSVDINLEQGTIRVSQTKNKKARVVYYTPCLRSELVEYIDARKKFLAENNISTHMLFFCTRANGRSKPGDSLSMRAIEQNIAYYGEYAGVSEVRVSPHTFRHTFARNFLVNGGDIFTLQQILGHSSLEMVRRYVKLFSSDVQSKYLDVMKRYTKSFGRRKKR